MKVKKQFKVYIKNKKYRFLQKIQNMNSKKTVNVLQIDNFLLSNRNHIKFLFNTNFKYDFI